MGRGVRVEERGKAAGRMIEGYKRERVINILQLTRFTTPARASVLPIFRGERHDRLRRVGGGEGVEFILGLIGSRIKDREQALARREDEGFHVRLTVRGQGLGDL